MNIRIEIGPNLYLDIENVSYTKAEPMVRYYPDGSGYPGSPAEVDYLESDCKLIAHGCSYDCPDGMSLHYYDEILEEVEKKIDSIKRDDVE